MTCEDYKEGDYVIVKLHNHFSHHWFGIDEVIKLGGAYWNGSFEGGFAAMSKQSPIGNVMDLKFQREYTIRHATLEEIRQSQWKDEFKAGEFPEKWHLKFKTIEVFNELCKPYKPFYLFYSEAGICNDNVVKVGNYSYLGNNATYGTEITYEQFKQFSKQDKENKLQSNKKEDGKRSKNSEVTVLVETNTTTNGGQKVKPRVESIRIICESGSIPNRTTIIKSRGGLDRIKAEKGDFYF